MKEFIQANLLSALVVGHILFFGIIIIKFFERKEKPKRIRIELDEHERMISQN